MDALKFIGVIITLIPITLIIVVVIKRGKQLFD